MNRSLMQDQTVILGLVSAISMVMGLVQLLLERPGAGVILAAAGIFLCLSALSSRIDALERKVEELCKK